MNVHEVTQHGKWDTLDGAALAMDRCSAMDNASRHAYLRVKILVGKDHPIATNEITAGRLGRFAWTVGR